MSPTSQYASVHVRRDHAHLKWSKNIEPVLTVSPGETVTFDAVDSSNGQLGKTSETSIIPSVDFSLVNPVFGPVYVRDAQPGDVLKVEVLDLETADWGWSAIIPGFGLLADEFTDPALNIWSLDKEKGYTLFKDNICVPMRPFLGCMGVAPASDDELSTVPPTVGGGNMDCRELSVGSVVYLPVQATGALFSCGDGHAAQGHGEVCGSAIETPLKATLRFEVCKNQPWVTSPQYQIPPGAQPQVIPDRGQYATMGIDSDLLEATKKALRNLIQWLVATKGLNRNEAYILASVVADLHIAEAVNMPNYEVAMSIPLGIFA
ncbi:Acetamidase formamidase [Aspergillus sclerotialis]|uniref:Acetamidase formamidase n=1 Tax=Aspergillus sclerotialis TaxID=2070753 RepID=A0A3A2ZWX1_9EURO|nr:Acetamidase formamidase [Aspergillus sclerotialis]